MDRSRVTKRARRRLACEPCRRKKSKCPGEKPTCSFCMRLGQPCHYAEETIHRSGGNADAISSNFSLPTHDNIRSTESRLKTLEIKLDEVVRAVGSQAEFHNRHRDQVSPSNSNHVALSPPEERGLTFAPSVLPSWEILESATRLYLKFCDCQPLSLFDPECLLETLRNRDSEVLFAILSVSLRFSEDDVLRDNIVDLNDGYAEAARRIVMHRVTNGPVELSTLQTLCLLSSIDFTNGHKHRASIYCSLAANLAQCAGLTLETSGSVPEHIQEERRRCFWSIFLLERLHGADMNVVDSLAEDMYPRYPKTTGSPSMNSSSSPTILLKSSQKIESKDLGVVAYAIQLSEVWSKTTRYARRRATPSSIPPWSPQSEYATIVAQQMDYETRMPYIHRFKPAGFANYSTSELNLNRGYWGPWLFIQFLYHTNLCLLNHPLIMALRLRNFQNMMPEIFLQHTSDLIATHASWIVHLIDTVMLKSYKISDPLLGHCAAIVATIFLQESISEDENVRKEKQRDFKKCFKFIQDLGEEWPHIARLADKLQQLQYTVSASYHSSTDPQVPTRGLLIDLARFWEVLEYSSASELSESAGLLFGPSLYSDRQHPVVEVTDMSSLPAPTRLRATTDHVDYRRTPNNESDNNSYIDSNVAGALPRTQLLSSINLDGRVIEPFYSNDELAVLAESFFNQRTEFVSNTDEWWNTGNL